MKLKRNIQGISLIEVLVTIVILAIGLLGLAGMQSLSMRSNNSAYYTSQATFSAYMILDHIRANKNKTASYEYDGISESPTVVPAGYTTADKDLRVWITLLSTVFPGGKGSVDCASDLICVATVSWDDVGSQTGKRQITVSTRI